MPTNTSSKTKIKPTLLWNNLVRARDEMKKHNANFTMSASFMDAGAARSALGNEPSFNARFAGKNKTDKPGGIPMSNEKTTYAHAVLFSAPVGNGTVSFCKTSQGKFIWEYTFTNGTTAAQSKPYARLSNCESGFARFAANLVLLYESLSEK